MSYFYQELKKAQLEKSSLVSPEHMDRVSYSAQTSHNGERNENQYCDGDTFPITLWKCLPFIRKRSFLQKQSTNTEDFNTGSQERGFRKLMIIHGFPCQKLQPDLFHIKCFMTHAGTRQSNWFQHKGFSGFMVCPLSWHFQPRQFWKQFCHNSQYSS